MISRVVWGTLECSSQHHIKILCLQLRLHHPTAQVLFSPSNKPLKISLSTCQYSHNLNPLSAAVGMKTERQGRHKCLSTPVENWGQRTTGSRVRSSSSWAGPSEATWAVLFLPLLNTIHSLETYIFYKLIVEELKQVFVFAKFILVQFRC